MCSLVAAAPCWGGECLSWSRDVQGCSALLAQGCAGGSTTPHILVTGKSSEQRNQKKGRKKSQTAQEGQCCQHYLPALDFLPKQEVPGESWGCPREQRCRVQEAPGGPAALQGLTFHCRVKHSPESWSVPGSVCDRVFLIYDVALFCSLALLRR